jgi:hypothetical protein
MNNAIQSLTKHAQQRRCERAIPPLIVEWLERFGSHEYDKRGCQVVWFDKQGRKRLERAVGKQIVESLRPLLDAYAVIGHGGAVVTLGWRTSRIKRN